MIQIDQKEHAQFTRKGDDLYMNCEIDLLTALAGGKFHITHLDSRTLIVSIVPGEIIRPSDVKCIQNEGMPGYKRPFDKGSLYVSFKINFPANGSLSPKDLQTLETCLTRDPMPMISGETEDVVLSNVDPIKQKRQQEEQEMDDEDGHGQPGVQCAQQ